jgi:hypothetical protein
MERKYKILMVMLYIVSMGSGIQACMTTFVNDSPGKLALYNKLDKTFMCISRNGKRRFGNHQKHAHFVVYMQQPKAKIEIWTPAYTCKQNRCGSSGNVLLKYSDIYHRTEVTGLYALKKHKAHSSMVGELPMIQNNSCNLCEDLN